MIKTRSRDISGVPAWAIYSVNGLVASSSGAVSGSDRATIKRFLNRRMGMQDRINL